MARKRLEPNAHNVSIHELKEAARMHWCETAICCTAIQMLTVGIGREQVCQALLVTQRPLRKWIKLFP